MERKGESEEQRVRVRERRDTERGDVKGTTPNKSKYKQYTIKSENS